MFYGIRLAIATLKQCATFLNKFHELYPIPGDVDEEMFYQFLREIVRDPLYLTLTSTGIVMLGTFVVEKEEEVRKIIKELFGDFVEPSHIIIQ